MVDAQRGDQSGAVEDRDQVNYFEELQKLLVELRLSNVMFDGANSIVDSSEEGKNGVRVKVKQSIYLEFSLHFSVYQQISSNVSGIKKSIIQDIEDNFFEGVAVTADD